MSPGRNDAVTHLAVNSTERDQTMLSDPLAVKILDTSVASSITVAETVSFATIDLSPGRSVRKCAAIGNMPAQLTIAHTVSNENKPLKTDRTLVRLDYTCISPATLVPVTAACYMVLAVPQGASVDTSTTDPLDPVVLVRGLLGVLAVSPSAATLSQANLLRIIAGEP